MIIKIVTNYPGFHNGFSVITATIRTRGIICDKKMTSKKQEDNKNDLYLNNNGCHSKNDKSCERLMQYFICNSYYLLEGYVCGSVS